MDIAIRETARLDSIITEFLLYARPPASNLKECDVNAVLADTLDLIRHEAQSHMNIVIVTYPGAVRCRPKSTRIKSSRYSGTWPRMPLKPCRPEGNSRFRPIAGASARGEPRRYHRDLVTRHRGRHQERASIRSFCLSSRRRSEDRGSVLPRCIGSSTYTEAGSGWRVRKARDRNSSSVCR